MGTQLKTVRGTLQISGALFFAVLLTLALYRLTLATQSPQAPNSTFLSRETTGLLLGLLSPI